MRKRRARPRPREKHLSSPYRASTNRRGRASGLKTVLRRLSMALNAVARDTGICRGGWGVVYSGGQEKVQRAG